MTEQELSRLLGLWYTTWLLSRASGDMSSEAQSVLELFGEDVRNALETPQGGAGGPAPAAVRAASDILISGDASSPFAPLSDPASRVVLASDKVGKTRHLRCVPLSCTLNEQSPVHDVPDAKSGLRNCLKQLQDDMARLVKHGPPFETVLNLYRKYTSNLPALRLAPDERLGWVTDESFYAQARLMSALSEVLFREGSNSDGPVARLVRVDLKGIQSYLYDFLGAQRATEEDEERRPTRRLRARSIIVSITAELAARHILAELDLGIQCLLLNAGGRFDLLLPANAEYAKVVSETSKALQNHFGTHLGLVSGCVPLTAKDFGSADDAYQHLNADLIRNRRAASRDRLGEEEFWVERKASSADADELEIEIGGFALKATHLALSPSAETATPRTLRIKGLRYQATPLDNADSAPNGCECLLDLRGPKAFLEGGPPAIGKCFRPLVNTAPRGQNDRALDFEEIAEQSKGAGRLGAIRMDVDNLGAIFARGLDKRATFAALATLSERLDLFFTGILNETLRDTPFYSVYSGGDDVFLIGPWDACVERAIGIEKDFHDFTSQNPSVTLSGGFAQLNPHTPIKFIAEFSGEAEERAKRDGKNRFHLFGKSLPWRADGNGLDVGAALEHAEKLVQLARLEDGLSRGFIWTLRRLYGTYGPDRRDAKEKIDLHWVPRFVYAVARNVPEETERDLRVREWFPKLFEWTPVVTDYALLKLRKR